MDISGMGSVYADYMTSQASNNKAETLQGRLANGSASTDEKELKEACRSLSLILWSRSSMR